MKLVKEFSETMRPVKGRRMWYYLGIVGMTIGNTSIGVVSAVLLKEFVDKGNITGLGSLNQIVKILVAYVLTLTILIPSCQYSYNRVAKLAFKESKQAIFYKILKLPIPYFEKVHSGKVLSVLINDCNKMMGVITARFRRTFAPFIQILTYIVPMLFFEWRITIVLIIINFLTLYGDLKFAKMIKKISKIVLEKQSHMNETLMNIFSGMLIVRMFSLDKVTSEYIDANEDMSKKDLKRAHINGLHSTYTFAVSMLNTVLFLLCANVLVMLDLTTYGSVLGIMSMQIILNESFKSFSQYLPQVIDGHAGTSRVLEFLDLPEEKMIQVEEADNLAYVEFRNVSFKYPETDEHVLKDFNLKLNEKETIAVIGESGCGKSTIAKLLLGFYPIEKGTIAVKGKPIHENTLQELRDLISYVPQDAYIFNGTIMENIRYGQLDATDEAIYKACKLANAYDFIVNLQNGFDTLVGERGTKLSGGQRQRIAIARAIIKNAPILILDEATASLDSESEAYIKSAIDEVRKHKTTLIIAHRLSTIEGADRVIKIA